MSGHYLVTGGAGFIGSHLCDALIAKGHRVSVLDDLSSGKRENLQEAVELIEGDCGDMLPIEALLNEISGVFHLAAIASVPQSLEHWSETSRVNQFAFITLLEALKLYKTPVVYASSAATYGDPDGSYLPIQETTPTIPLTPYGIDKLGCEQHARIATDQFDIPTMGLRFFNVYGPRQDPKSPYSGVISIFQDRLSQGKPVTIFGDGSQSRDFIYVADVVNHLMASMQRLQETPKPEAKVLNVCTGTQTTVLELAETMAEVGDYDLTVNHAPQRAGDIVHSLGAPELAQSVLEVKAGYDLRAGLAELLKR